METDRRIMTTPPPMLPLNSIFSPSSSLRLFFSQAKNPVLVSVMLLFNFLMF
jgi:hypothetical protein